MTRRLRVIAEQPDASTDALRTLARALLPFLRDELALERRDDELVDVLKHCAAEERDADGNVTRGTHARAVMHACRSGAIIDARHVGRRWIATRAAIDAWTRARGPRLAKKGDDGLEAMRERLARGHR